MSHVIRAVVIAAVIVSRGDFVDALIRDAQDANEYAFALGGCSLGCTPPAVPE